MNIEHLFPESGLTVGKVTNVITSDKLNLLVKLAEGKIPTGYRQEEIDQIIQEIRSASVEACKTIFNKDNLEAKKENQRWPWFDLRDGEGKASGESGVFNGNKRQPIYFAEFVVTPSNEGGEIKFDKISSPVSLSSGEMLVSSREEGYEFEITKVSSGIRFVLLTLITLT